MNEFNRILGDAPINYYSDLVNILKILKEYEFPSQYIGSTLKTIFLLTASGFYRTYKELKQSHFELDIKLYDSIKLLINYNEENNKGNKEVKEFLVKQMQDLNMI